MNTPERGGLRRRLNQLSRRAFSLLPRDWRFALYRQIVDCNPQPDARLQLGIASTVEDLEACFALLHDAYVASGFMQPDPSGLRVTPYHALPTTTTLYAKWDGQVVGTLTIIREGVFGFPLQTIFDLTTLRAQPGRIAEISALAVHPRFRKTGGVVLFPLMKFMHDYCLRYFDVRHLVIAVNPNRIEMYEALLMFRRLEARVVDHYDFANGAPAVGATLDLHAAFDLFRGVYDGRRERRNLHRYFMLSKLPHIHFPERRYFTTNDPVMSPALLDHFFNRRTQVFAQLDERRRRLLHAIYPEEGFAPALPPLPSETVSAHPLRRHRRHSLKCPARLEYVAGGLRSIDIEVIDISLNGFLARANERLTDDLRGVVCVRLGEGVVSNAEAVVVREVVRDGALFYGFSIDAPDLAWQQCIFDLEARDAPQPVQRTLPMPLDPPLPRGRVVAAQPA